GTRAAHHRGASGHRRDHACAHRLPRCLPRRVGAGGDDGRRHLLRVRADPDGGGGSGQTGARAALHARVSRHRPERPRAAGDCARRQGVRRRSHPVRVGQRADRVDRADRGVGEARGADRRREGADFLRQRAASPGGAANVNPACDLVLTNAHVLTMDEHYTIYPSGSVAIGGGVICAVGRLGPEYDGIDTLDCRGRVVMPGLVNAHTHAPMTMLRGLADDLRLDVWLLGYMMPVERAFVRPDFVSLGTRLACAEMIRSGTTCFADMYYFEEAVATAASEAGMRAVCGQTALKFPPPDATSFEDSLARARDFIGRWKTHPLVVPAIAPHAPYTCTVEILRACAELACETDVPLLTHLAETALEVDQSRREHGMPVIPWVMKQGLFGARVVAAHCVHVDEGEIRSLKNAKVGVAHNPTSNLKLGSGVAPVAKMLSLGVTVGIGTDGAASNNDLDMFEEIRLAALLAKGINGDPTALPARDALAMATRIGAQAVHLGAVTGSLEVGKRADLIVVDVDQVHNVPGFGRDHNAIYSQLVYAAKSTDVVDVMCDGRWLMRDRRLLTLDEDTLRAGARDVARRIDAFLVEREQSVLQKLVAIGGAAEGESFEVQVKARIDSEDTVRRALASDSITVIRSVHYHQY